MKRRNVISGLAILTGLLILLGASGHGAEDQGQYNMERDRFHMGTDFMDINGTVDITDNGIVFSVTMEPNMEAKGMMGDGHMGEDMGSDMGENSTMGDGNRPGDRDPRGIGDDTQTGSGAVDASKNDERGRFMGNVSNPDTMKNQMNITLFALVEFEDQGIAGFDSNDTVVSTYYLNTSTLNALDFDGNRTYTITSKDGIFKLTLLANTEGMIGWKWSVEIVGYNFVSNTSSIAMLHEITTLYNDVHMQRGMGNGVGNQTAYMQMTNGTIRSDGMGAPMFFSWISNATVDGSVETVTVTRGDVLAISIPQGNKIFYDPSFGVSQDVVSEIDSSIGLLSADTQTTTPTTEALFPALFAGIGLVAIFLIKRQKQF